MDVAEGEGEGGWGGVVYDVDGDVEGGPVGLGGAGEDDVGVFGGVGVGGGGEVAEDGEAEAGCCACEGDEGHCGFGLLFFGYVVWRFGEDCGPGWERWKLNRWIGLLAWIQGRCSNGLD